MVNSTTFDTNASIKQEDQNAVKVCANQNNSVDVSTRYTVSRSSTRQKNATADGQITLNTLAQLAIASRIESESKKVTKNAVAVENSDDEDNSLCCSVPLDKVQSVLTTLNYPKYDEPKHTRKLLCLYCERSFASTNLRSKHVERIHSIKKNRRLSSRKQQLTVTSCIYCDKLNSSENTLKDLFQHFVNEHSNKYFGCLSCEERFLTKALLSDHHASLHSNIEIPKITVDVTETDIQEKEAPVKLTRSRIKAKLETNENPRKLTVRTKNAKLKELRSKKLTVKSSRIAYNRRESKRLQALAKLTEAQKKKRQKPVERKQINTSKFDAIYENAKPTSICVNPYPEFDHFYRVKKITDHSIDNLKINSLTFDDVFDKAFFNRIKCNIEDNLLHHIDGKLFKNEESESRISNFEKISTTYQELQNSTSDNYGCELSLNAVTPIAALSLNSHFGEDFESQIEYGSKPSKKKTQTKKDEVHYKYFTRRKFQASILEHKENRDLSKLDMWTQLIIKKRQQKIIDDKKSAKEILEYSTCDEYKNKMKREELNRILDRRGPFEDLREEASKKAALDKLNSASEDSISHESFTEVREVINKILSRVFTIAEDSEEVVEQTTNIRTNLKPDHREIPSFLKLRRTSTVHSDDEIDQSDKITLICSSQDTENFELPTNTTRGKNELVELSGEWARSRMYICAACGFKLPNMKYLLDHKTVYHQNVWVQHYEFVGNQSELYRHLSIPALGKVGFVENNVSCKMWKRSDARVCSKCKKQCNSLGELHRHILECGGDWTWILVRKKCKYRYGAKSRRKRRGMVLKVHTKRKADSTEKKTYKYNGPRQRPSDAETIQRMLADLPAKRSTRKLISLYDGVRRRQKTKELENVKEKKVKCGKVIYDKSSNVKETTEKTINTAIPLKQSQINNKSSNARSLRSLNRVLSSRILDTNTKLSVKRKLKVLNEKRRTRQSDKDKQDEVAGQPLRETKKIKPDTHLAPKRTSPRSANIVRTLKLFTGNTNIKSFFPVKKRKVKEPTPETKDIQTRSRKKSSETEEIEKVENCMTKVTKNNRLSTFVRSLSMNKKKNQDKLPEGHIKKVEIPKLSTFKEELELNRRKRNLKQSFRNVINRVKRLKIDATPDTVQTEISEKPQHTSESNFLDEREQEKEHTVKIVIPFNIEAKENIADISENAHTVIVVNETNGDSRISENIFKLDSNDEKNLQAKGERTPSTQEKPPAEDKIKDVKNTKDKVKLEASVKPKIRKPARGLNDCIAMLTSKLQQKNTEIETTTKSSSSNISISNNQPKISYPRLQVAECILKIPTFKTQNEPIEEVALDLSTKSRNKESEQLGSSSKPKLENNFLWDFSRLTSVERIIENVVNNKLQEQQKFKLEPRFDSIDQTIQNVIDGYYLKQKAVFIRTTVDDIIDYVINSTENCNLIEIAPKNTIEPVSKVKNGTENINKGALDEDIENSASQMALSKKLEDTNKEAKDNSEFEQNPTKDKPFSEAKKIDPTKFKKKNKKFSTDTQLGGIIDTKKIEKKVPISRLDLKSDKIVISNEDEPQVMENKTVIQDVVLPILVKSVKIATERHIDNENTTVSDTFLNKYNQNLRNFRKQNKGPKSISLKDEVRETNEKSENNVKNPNSSVTVIEVQPKEIYTIEKVQMTNEISKTRNKANQRVENTKNNKATKNKTVDKEDESSSLKDVCKKEVAITDNHTDKTSQENEKLPIANNTELVTIEKTSKNEIISFKTKRKKKGAKKTRFTKKKTKKINNGSNFDKYERIGDNSQIKTETSNLNVSPALTVDTPSGTSDDTLMTVMCIEKKDEKDGSSDSVTKSKSVSTILKPAVLSLTTILNTDFLKEENKFSKDIECLIPTFELKPQDYLISDSKTTTNDEIGKTNKKPAAGLKTKKALKRKRLTMTKKKTIKFVPLSYTCESESESKDVILPTNNPIEKIQSESNSTDNNNVFTMLIAKIKDKDNLGNEIISDDTSKENIEKYEETLQTKPSDNVCESISDIDNSLETTKGTKKYKKSAKKGLPVKINKKVKNKTLLSVENKEKNVNSGIKDLPEIEQSNLDIKSKSNKLEVNLKTKVLSVDIANNFEKTFEEESKKIMDVEQSMKTKLEIQKKLVISKSKSNERQIISLNSLSNLDATFKENNLDQVNLPNTRLRRTARSLGNLSATTDKDSSLLDNSEHGNLIIKQKTRLMRTTKSLENVNIIKEKTDFAVGPKINKKKVMKSNKALEVQGEDVIINCDLENLYEITKEDEPKTEAEKEDLVALIKNTQFNVETSSDNFIKEEHLFDNNEIFDLTEKSMEVPKLSKAVKSAVISPERMNIENSSLIEYSERPKSVISEREVKSKSKLAKKLMKSTSLENLNTKSADFNAMAITRNEINNFLLSAEAVNTIKPVMTKEIYLQNSIDTSNIQDIHYHNSEKNIIVGESSGQSSENVIKLTDNTDLVEQKRTKRKLRASRENKEAQLEENISIFEDEIKHIPRRTVRNSKKKKHVSQDDTTDCGTKHNLKVDKIGLRRTRSSTNLIMSSNESSLLKFNDSLVTKIISKSVKTTKKNCENSSESEMLLQKLNKKSKNSVLSASEACLIMPMNTFEIAQEQEKIASSEITIDFDKVSGENDLDKTEIVEETHFVNESNRDSFQYSEENTSSERSDISLLEEKIRNAIRQSLMSTPNLDIVSGEKFEKESECLTKQSDLIDTCDVGRQEIVKKTKKNKKSTFLLNQSIIDITSPPNSNIRSSRRKSSINCTDTKDPKTTEHTNNIKPTNIETLTKDFLEINNSSEINDSINKIDDLTELTTDDQKLEECDLKNKESTYILKENLTKNTLPETNTVVNKQRAKLRHRKDKTRLIRMRKLNVAGPEVDYSNIPTDNAVVISENILKETETDSAIPKEINIEKEPPIKIIINKRKARRKSKSTKKVVPKGQNHLYEDFALVIKKNRSAPIMTFSPPDTFSKEDTYPMDAHIVQESKRISDESVEEMDMELDEIPINSSIIETAKLVIPLTIPQAENNEKYKQTQRKSHKTGTKKKRGSKSRINKIKTYVVSTGFVEDSISDNNEEIPPLRLNLKSDNTEIDNYSLEAKPSVSGNSEISNNFVLDKDDFSSDDFDIDNTFEDSIISEDNTPKQPSVDAETLFKKLFENSEFVKPLVLSKNKTYDRKVDHDTLEPELENDDLLNKEDISKDDISDKVDITSVDSLFDILKPCTKETSVEEIYENIEKDNPKPVVKSIKKSKKKGAGKKLKPRTLAAEKLHDVNKDSNIEVLNEETSYIKNTMSTSLEDDSTSPGKKSVPSYLKSDELRKEDIDKLYAFSETEDFELEKPIELPKRLPRKNESGKYKEETPTKEEKISNIREHIEEKLDLNFSGVFNEEKISETLKSATEDKDEINNTPIVIIPDLEGRKKSRSVKANKTNVTDSEKSGDKFEFSGDLFTNKELADPSEQEETILKKSKMEQKKNEKFIQLNESFKFPSVGSEVPLLEDLVAELDGLEELENSIERELNSEINLQKEKSKDHKEQIDSDLTVEQNQELRRSRRGSRKVTSYNENDLLDPLIDALEMKRISKKKDEKSIVEVKKKKEVEKKLNSEELFDLLKASKIDDLYVPKQQNSFLNTIECCSRNVTDEHFDNIFENMLVKTEFLSKKKGNVNKICEFSENTDNRDSFIGDEPKKSKKLKQDIESVSESQDSISKSKSKNYKYESNFCEICNKSFVKLENLIKHRRTLTHIQKLSELEAKEAEKSKIINEISSESLLHSPELETDLKVDILTNKDNNMQTPFNVSDSLKLADIINDVLNKPVLPDIDEQPNKFSDIILQNDGKRYKSLGERKSFDSETIITSKSHLTEPTKTILEKQISLLENIIENQTTNNYIDDISLSSENTDTPTEPRSPIVSKPIPVNSFIKPTQYEEISEDSVNLRNYDDQKLRKTLNRDEELFLECCSLLKSSSEVSSSYSNKNIQEKILGALRLKSLDEQKWVEKNILEKNAINDYSDNSRIPTPLGNSFNHDASNSNTISSNWGMDKSVENNKEVEEPTTSFSFENITDKKSEDNYSAGFDGILSDKRTEFVVNDNVTSHRSSTDKIKDSYENRKIMTKGAKKVFESLKVSIPTEELNMDEVLNNSPKQKKSETTIEKSNKEEKLFSPTSKRKSKPVKKAQIGSNLLFKVTKKKHSAPNIPKDQQDKGYDVYDFEETQDNTDAFTKPNYRTFRTQQIGENESDSESRDCIDSFIEPEPVTFSASTTKKSREQENITKKKYMIMGRIFKNAAKSKIEDVDEEMRSIPIIDNVELVGNYIAECKKVIKDECKTDKCQLKPKSPVMEINKWPEEEKDHKQIVKPSKSGLTKMDVNKKKVKRKGKKRIRTNSDSTDDEFSLSKTIKRKTSRKNAKEEDNCINLEQELKECMGVASRKSQRKCTSGKQNVLVEYWSSDESQFEALLEKRIVNHPPIVSNETDVLPAVIQEIKNPIQKKKSSENKNNKSEDQTVDNSSSNRRKRAAVNPLYHWSSSSEDEANDFIEVKPLRDGLEEDEDRPVQHGWIVGDSPKKLVTMLAQAKGKKADIESVKEQSKKRTNTVS